MRCVVIHNPGLDSHLEIIEQPTPLCTDEQLLIKVHAAALNRADLMQRQGKYPPPAGESAIPGLEVAGEIIAIGSKVTRFAIGEHIYGLVGSGGYASHCLVEQRLAEHIPAGWDMIHAAALPESLATVHATVFMHGKFAAQQRLLAHAAGSGITSMAIQMAKLIGATIFTTVSNDHKMALAKQLGADKVINYKREDFATIITPNSLDIILDFIGGDYFTNHVTLLKTEGRLIQIACLNGNNVTLNLAQLMYKRLQIIGFVLRAQPLEEKAKIWQSAHNQWRDALENQQLKPVIDSTFAFSEIEKAQQRMLHGENFGKIVILMD